jgi:hypothetical protein
MSRTARWASRTIAPIYVSGSEGRPARMSPGMFPADLTAPRSSQGLRHGILRKLGCAHPGDHEYLAHRALQ